jgi:hypothetical protein
MAGNRARARARNGERSIQGEFWGEVLGRGFWGEVLDEGITVRAVATVRDGWYVGQVTLTASRTVIARRRAGAAITARP